MNNGPCKIEVQLKKGSFYLKRARSGFDGSPVVSWSKHGSIEAAWQKAAERVGWYVL